MDEGTPLYDIVDIFQIVYRETSAGEYEGVKVEAGPRMRGLDDQSYYPVLRGLEAGDQIVTTGSFWLKRQEGKARKTRSETADSPQTMPVSA